MARRSVDRGMRAVRLGPRQFRRHRSVGGQAIPVSGVGALRKRESLEARAGRTDLLVEGLLSAKNKHVAHQQAMCEREQVAGSGMLREGWRPGLAAGSRAVVCCLLSAGCRRLSEVSWLLSLLGWSTSQHRLREPGALEPPKVTRATSPSPSAARAATPARPPAPPAPPARQPSAEATAPDPYPSMPSTPYMPLTPMQPRAELRTATCPLSHYRTIALSCCRSSPVVAVHPSCMSWAFGAG
jgi:hypothetical protein